MGHEVRCYEEMGSWSLSNLMQEGEIASRAIDQFRREFPELDVRFYQRDETLQEMLADELGEADIVIIHEWTDPDIAAAILSYKARIRISRAVSRYSSSRLHECRRNTTISSASVRWRSGVRRADQAHLSGRLWSAARVDVSRGR